MTIQLEYETDFYKMKKWLTKFDKSLLISL